MSKPPTILFVAAMNVDRQVAEFNAISEVFKYLDEDERPIVHYHKDLDVSDLIDAIQTYKPTILHISTHGSEAGVWLGQAGGGFGPIPAEVLAQILEKRAVPCVVLSACGSSTQAEAISRDGGITLGFQGALTSVGATAFFRTWYQEIFGRHKDLVDAFESSAAVLATCEDCDTAKPCLLPSKAALSGVRIKDLRGLRVLGIFAGARNVDNVTLTEIGREISSIKKGLKPHRATSRLIEAMDPSIEELYITIFDHRPEVIHLHAAAAADGNELEIGNPAETPPVVLEDLFSLIAKASRSLAECMLLWSQVDPERVRNCEDLPATHVVVLDPNSSPPNRAVFAERFYGLRGQIADSSKAFEKTCKYHPASHECIPGPADERNELRRPPAIDVHYFLLRPPERSGQLDYAEEILRARRAARLVGPNLRLDVEWDVSPKDFEHSLKDIQKRAVPNTEKVLVISGVCDGAGFDTRRDGESELLILGSRLLGTCIKEAELQASCILLLSSYTGKLARELSKELRHKTTCIGYDSVVEPVELAAYMEGFLLGYGTHGSPRCGHELGCLINRMKNQGSGSEPVAYPALKSR